MTIKDEIEHILLHVEPQEKWGKEQGLLHRLTIHGDSMINAMRKA